MPANSAATAAATVVDITLRVSLLKKSGEASFRIPNLSDVVDNMVDARVPARLPGRELPPAK